LLPFFVALDLPSWLGWLAVALQFAGLALEVASELQLMRNKSFAVSSKAATTVQKAGLYRWLENPIYVGIIVQIIGWALWMPLVFITVAMFLPVLRSMVTSERQFLATQHNATHRGLDSFLWN
jgi:protein-S-isoprenylcysteine O-methyltransferase Ste14